MAEKGEAVPQSPVMTSERLESPVTMVEVWTSTIRNMYVKNPKRFSSRLHT